MPKNKKPKNDKTPKQSNEEKSSSNMFANLRNNLKDKYKLDELKEEISEIDDEVEEVTPSQESKSCLADSIGWNDWRTLLKNFVYGIFMGFSDGIPGYSGGTTLSIIGFYENLIANVKLIIKPDVKKYFWKYLIWFLPFLVAWIGIFFGFSKLISTAGENGHGIILVFLFAFFALFSIPIFYIKNKDDLLNYKTFSQELKAKDRRTLFNVILFLFAFILLISFALMARFIPESFTKDGTKIIGVTFLGEGSTFANQINNSNSFDTSKVFLWLIGGFLAGFCMLVPGVSGGLVLYMTNIYPDFTYALSNSFTNPNLIPWVVIVALGAVCGVICSSFCINWLLKKFKFYFMNFSFGLVCASFLSIFISLSSNDYATLSNSTNLGVSIAMIFIAIFINIAIFIALNETGKINYPRWRIKTILKQKEAKVSN